MHEDGVSIWIVSHESGNNKFRSYLLAPNGLDPIPIISEIGPIISNSDIESDAIGMIDIAPNSKSLALQLQNFGVWLFDFNANSGSITNERAVYLTGNGFQPRSVAFSSNSQNFYFITYDLNLEECKYYQIPLSQISMATNANIFREDELRNTGMKLAPNGKIYIGRVNNFNYQVIENPNSLINELNVGYFNPLEGFRAGLFRVCFPNSIASFSEGIDINYNLYNCVPNEQTFTTTKVFYDSLIWQILLKKNEIFRVLM